MIAAELFACRGGRNTIACGKPFFYIIVIELFAPQQTAKRLAHDGFFVGCYGGNHRAIKLIGFIAAFPNQTALNAGWKWTLATLTPEYAIAADINPGKGGISLDRKSVV